VTTTSSRLAAGLRSARPVAGRWPAGLTALLGVVLSVPSIVSASGARPIRETTFDEKELELFHRSADAIRASADSLR